MEYYDADQTINIGIGEDISIADLAAMLKRVVGFKGRLVFDTTKPDGTPRKLVDISRIRGLGWSPMIPMEAGIRSTYDWYLSQEAMLTFELANDDL